MTISAADRVKETSTTTGTGTYDLAGAASGFRTFVAGVGDDNLCTYLAEMGADWELGVGTVNDATPDTLARTRVILSTNGNAAVDWGAGTKNISCVPAAATIRDVTAPKGYLWGLTMDQAVADTTNDINVATGETTSEDGDQLMVLSSALTKQIDVAWAVGNLAGGMNTGSVANDTWYEVHLIKRVDTGVVDVMFTTTANRATRPTGYTHSRRIGWVRRATGNNVLFVQVDDYFTLFTALNDVAVSKTTTRTNVTLTVPPNSIARFRAGVDSTTSANANAVTLFNEIAEDTTAPSATTGHGSLGYADLATWYTAGHFELRVNSSSQIAHDSTVAQGALDIMTFGWIDNRRRLSTT